MITLKQNNVETKRCLPLPEWKLVASRRLPSACHRGEAGWELTSRSFSMCVWTLFITRHIHLRMRQRTGPHSWSNFETITILTSLIWVALNHGSPASLSPHLCSSFCSTLSLVVSSLATVYLRDWPTWWFARSLHATAITRTWMIFLSPNWGNSFRTLQKIWGIVPAYYYTGCKRRLMQNQKRLVRNCA